MSTTTKHSGAEILIEALKREGVELLFGYPGGAVLPIYDVLYDCGLVHILSRHEQGAAHAADGYARATGRTGVCLATSGPGATNLVTGIATAYMDSVPMVAFTGQVGSPLIGRDSFQEADITGITLPITKHSYLVKDVRDLPRIIKEAFHVASTGRQGPVLVDLPKDILAAKVRPDWPESVDIPGYKPTYNGHPKQIGEAARALSHARRPVIYAGGGVVSSGASMELVELAELLTAPVVTTLMGMGAFPGVHPLYLGMLGMHGMYAANHAVSESDLLLAVGARFDDRVTSNVQTFAPGAKVVHIDIDPAEIGKNVHTHIPIVGDAKGILRVLIDAVALERGKHSDDSSEWMARIDAWKAEATSPSNGVEPDCGCADESARERSLKPQAVIRHLCEATRCEAVVVTDVGQHQMWAAHYYTYNKPRSFITSGGLGTMGYGLPAAIGAAMGRPGETVILISGDGSIQMNSQELATASIYNVPVKIAIMNNGYLGMVRQWQEIFFQGRYSHVNLAGGPDFVKLAESYGVKGMRAETADEMRSVVDEALNHPGPVLMDFRVEAQENVFPMVPPNGAINKMMLSGRQL